MGIIGKCGGVSVSSFGNLLGLTGEEIILIPMDQLHDFKEHPFQVKDDEAMDKLVESVREQGVLVPILVRKLEEERYEIIAGHRRKLAANLAGKRDIPAIVKKMDDDEAIIAMVDSNLQREEILPSEKAFSYKMKLEALKRQGRRTDLTSGNGCQKLNAREQIAEDGGESETSVRNYIRLTELIPELLHRVDQKTLLFRSALEITFLNQDEQQILLKVMDDLQVSPSIAQAAKLKQLSQESRCGEDAVFVVLSEKPVIERRFLMKAKKLSEYFTEDTTQEQIEEIIFSLLDRWRAEKENTEGA